MSAEERDAIHQAVQQLEQSVAKLIQRAEMKRGRTLDDENQRRVRRVIRHIRHLLLQLLERRTSLQALLSWFRDEWRRLESYLPQCPQPILEHAMKHLIRCQDGLVLLTSGECRHPVDIQDSKSTNFRSRLLTIEERNDGYTKLYSGSAYSGFGWDEYANESVGLQTRLSKALQGCHKHPWRFLEDHTEALENLWSRQENVVKQLQQELRALKNQMEHDITKRLAKPTLFATQDKMEKLEVFYDHKTYTLERRANDFEITGQSVLPNERQRSKDWNRSEALDIRQFMKAPSEASMNRKVGQKRHRPVIEDSDSDRDDNTGNCSTDSKPKATRLTNAPTQAVGLRTRVQEAHTQPVQHENSLSKIKAQMGVDVHGLELSREELEGESTNSNRQNRIDTMKSDEELEVQRQERVLHRVKQRKGHDLDENEIWDAREVLRQAHMALGNIALWSEEHNNLEMALESFERARDLTIKQQKEHKLTVARTNDNTPESQRIYRNLFLLLGKAMLNIGISLVQIGEQATKNATKKDKMKCAIWELCRARQLFQDTRKKSQMDLFNAVVHSRHWVEVIADVLEADKFDSLACQWIGIASWPATASDSATATAKAFEDGWSIFRRFEKEWQQDSVLLELALEVAAEALYATHALVDLARAALEKLKLSAKRTEGSKYMELIQKSLGKQIEIEGVFEALESSTSSHTSEIVAGFRQDHEIFGETEARKSLQNVEEWWISHLENAARIGQDSALSLRTHVRHDIGTSCVKTNAPHPTARCIVGERSRRRREHQENVKIRHRKSSSMKTLKEISKDLPEIPQNEGKPLARRPTKFRKWGDQLLQVDSSAVANLKGGNQAESEPGNKERLALPYPSTAPPLPVEFRAIFEAQRASMLQLTE